METFETIIKLNNHLKEKHEDGKRNSSLPFECNACGRGYMTYDSLKFHRKLEGPFHLNECSLCHEQLETWAEHQKHLDEKHDGKFMHRCGICGVSSFDTDKQKINHHVFCRLVKSKKQAPFVDDESTACTICGVFIEGFKNKIKKHLREFHPERMVARCIFCGDVFFSEKNHRLHVLKYHGRDKFGCDTCEMVFSTKAAVRRHQEHQHGSKKARKVWKCDECDKEYLNIHSLRMHKKAHQLGGKLPQTRKMCELCGVEMRKDSWRNHMQRTHGTAQIVCEYEQCDKTFKHQRIYKEHVKLVHTLITCEECGKQMPSLAQARHKKVFHTPDSKKTHVCSVCGKGFVVKQAYLDHMNIHTGDKPHQCKFCSMRFSDSCNCRKHMRSSHREEYKHAKDKRPDKAS